MPKYSIDIDSEPSTFPLHMSVPNLVLDIASEPVVGKEADHIVGGKWDMSLICKYLGPARPCILPQIVQ